MQVDHFDRAFDTPLMGKTSDNFMDDDFDSAPSTNITPNLKLTNTTQQTTPP
jgi:hypothetical protein